MSSHRHKLLLTLSLCALVVAGDASGGSRSEARRRARSERTLQASALAEVYRAEARCNVSRDDIDLLKQIIATQNPQGEQRADMLLRLAELYADGAREVYLDEQYDFEAQQRRCAETPDCSPDALTVDHAVSVEWYNKAAQLYREVLTIAETTPQFPHADLATFGLGGALRDAGQPDEALSIFEQFVVAFPDSAYMPDALVQIGDYHFENNSALKALVAYQRAATWRDATIYPYALYKLAWCYFNVGEYGDAITDMTAVVQISDAGRKVVDPRGQRLGEAPVEDLVKLLDANLQLADAWRLLDDPRHTQSVTEAIIHVAETRIDRGFADIGIAIYHNLIDNNPLAVTAARFQARIVATQLTLRPLRPSLDEALTLARLYGADSAWARANAANSDAVGDAGTQIERYLYLVAITAHDENRGLDSPGATDEYNALTVQASTTYLALFPATEHSALMHRFLGDQAYKKRRYEEAYTHHRAAFETGQEEPERRYAALARIVDAEAIVDFDRRLCTEPVLRGEGPPVPLTLWEQNLVQAYDAWGTGFPDDRLTATVQLHAAYILHQRGQSASAKDPSAAQELAEYSERVCKAQLGASPSLGVELQGILWKLPAHVNQQLYDGSPEPAL